MLVAVACTVSVVVVGLGMVVIYTVVAFNVGVLVTKLQALFMLLSPTLAYMPHPVKYRTEKATQAHTNHQIKKAIKA
ncbi:MAG: hypothetical protein H7331_12135 [Bacteroidia bacterium]|nr:hypothetical protein [Bacteroidia bacterium]